MLRETYEKLLTLAITQVSNGAGNDTVENPALAFTRRAKAGEFDSWTNQEYNASLEDCDSISKKIFNKQSCQTWNTVLRNTLMCAKLDNVHAAVTAFADHSRYNFLRHKYGVRYDPVYDQLIYGDKPEDDCDYISPADVNICYEKEPDTFRTTPSVTSLDSPLSVYKYLCRHVHAQDAAKKAAASLLWTHATKHLKRNLLVIGPSGTGKTFIWKELAKIYPFIKIINAAQLSAESWSGGYKLRDIFDGMSKEEAENSIYVFDEFDKRIAPVNASSANGSGLNYAIQNEMLRLLDGEDMFWPEDPKEKKKELYLHTNHMSFVLTGTFEHMLSIKNASTSRPIGFGAGTVNTCGYTDNFTPDDLVQHANMRTEIAGRIHQIVQLQPFTSNDYYHILQTPSMSPVAKLEEQYGIHISLDDASMHLLAKQAEDNKMGVRYMTARLTEMLDHQLFDNCQSDAVTLSCID